MKSFKKVFSVVLCIVLFVQMGCMNFGSAAAADYTIVNPYAEVIWSGDDAWGAYKGSLHSHTTYSDADESLSVMVKASYEQGYDFLAIADHGVTGVAWDESPYLHPLYLYQPILGNTFEHLTTEEYEAIQNGTYNDRGYGMTPVLGANEFNNLSLSKNHVNGHFLKPDEGNAFPGSENEAGFDQALSYIDEHGGISYINHPGDWLATNANPAEVNDPENIEFFGNLILKYDSCFGIEVFNERNGTTGYDRVLWDNLLMYTLPYGKTVIGYSNTDAHHTGTIDSSYSIFMMEENNIENIEKTMKNGAFFGITRKLRENKLNEIGPDKELDVIDSDLPIPMFTNISVDGHSITVSAENSTTLQWIANGKVIFKADVTGGQPVTINLDEIEGVEDFLYVRAELFGEGGICVSQAFVIDDGSEPLEYKEASGIDTIITFITNFFKGTKIWTILVELYREIM